MSISERIYLDNAATSWPKPSVVYEAVDSYQRQIGAPAGRGVYREAMEVEEIVRNCRQSLAKLLNIADPRQLVFGFNGTDVLNQAIHGLIRAGDHVITTDVEHNSVLRPLRFLRDMRGISVTYVPCDSAGVIDPDDVRKSLTSKRTALVAVTHASNVTGAIQPIAQIAAMAQEHGAICLVDAAQTVGHIPIDVQELDVDLLAAPGHKGLLGPLGTGILYVRPGLEKSLRPLRQGGTGTVSEQDRQPDSLPDKFESGNHNVAGLAGLGASANYLQEIGLPEIQSQSHKLISLLLTRLCEIEEITVLGPQGVAQRVGVVSVIARDYTSHELAALLDATAGVQTRGGFHCAPRIHRSLKTLAHGGALRMSVGLFNTLEEINLVADLLADLMASPKPC